MKVGFDRETGEIIDLDDPEVAKGYVPEKKTRYHRTSKNLQKAEDRTTLREHWNGTAEAGGESLEEAIAARQRVVCAESGVDSKAELEEYTKRMAKLLINGDDADSMVFMSPGEIRVAVEDAEKRGLKLQYKGRKDLFRCELEDTFSKSITGRLEVVDPEHMDPVKPSLCEFLDALDFNWWKAQEFEKIQRLADSESMEERMQSMAELRVKNAQKHQLRALAMSESLPRQYRAKDGDPRSLESMITERVHISDERATEAVKEYISIQKQMEELNACCCG